MTPSDDETHVVLLLDLATEHPIHADLVLSRMPDPSSAKVFRLTDHGAAQCATGTPDDWAPVIPAISALVLAAQEAQRDGRPCRYWVAGRAGLPAFFHLGYLLSGRSTVTLVNRRKTGESDVLSLGTPGAAARRRGAPRYFKRTAPPAERDRSGLPLGLIVSSGIDVPPEQALSALSARGITPAAILEAQAGGLLDDTVLISAVGELDEMVSEVLHWYPDSKSLAVFVAGPATLAFLAGRALSANIFPDIQVFEHRDKKYQLAYETLPKHTILFLASSPSDMSELELRREAEEIRRELDLGGRGDRFQIVHLWAARPMDLLRSLRGLRPSVLHFAGHGGSSGLYFQAEDGSGRAVSAEVLEAVLDTVEASVQVVVLNACDSERQAVAVARRATAVVSMTGKIPDAAARSFAIGFYGGLGGGETLAAAFRQGRVAIQLGAAAGPAPSARDVLGEGETAPYPDHERPKLEVRGDIDPNQFVLVRRPRR